MTIPLLAQLQQAVDHVHNSLLQGPELEPQLSNSLGSIEAVSGRKRSASVALGCQILLLGELFSDNVANLLVAVGRVGNEVSLSSSLWLLKGQDVGFGNCEIHS